MVSITVFRFRAVLDSSDKQEISMSKPALMAFKKNLIIVYILILICVCSVLQPHIRFAFSDDVHIQNKRFNSEFRHFLYEFFNNPEFQLEHISFPLTKTYIDMSADPEPKEVTLTINRKEWRHLSGDKHYTCKMSCYDIVLYDNFEREFKVNTERVLSFEGVENGINEAFYFKYEENHWMLVKWEDLST